MSGTKEGAAKARAKMLLIDPDYYKKIGAIGGRNGHTGGFYDRALAERAGAKGGSISKRLKGKFTKRELMILRKHLIDENMFGKIVYTQCYRWDGTDRVIFVTKERQLDITIPTAKGCKYEEITQQLKDYFIREDLNEKEESIS